MSNVPETSGNQNANTSAEYMQNNSIPGCIQTMIVSPKVEHDEEDDDDEKMCDTATDEQKVVYEPPKEPPKQDPLKVFFHSMYQGTKKLPEHFQRIIKRKLFNSVIEAEEKFYYYTSTKCQSS